MGAEEIEAASYSAVQVETESSFGCGVVVDVKGPAVLSVAHVVEGRKDFFVFSRRGSRRLKHLARLEVVDPKNDLALLRFIKPYEGPVADFSEELPKEMERLTSIATLCKVHSVGCEWLIGRIDKNEYTLTGGVVMSGSSGAPLFDPEGDLVSLIRASYLDGNLPVYNFAYSIPLPKIRAFLKRCSR
jgi:hypothetical protein